MRQPLPPASPRRTRPSPPVHRGALARLAALGLALAPALPTVAAELPTRAEAREVNDRTVGIVFHYEDVYQRMIADMAEHFVDDGVRLVPIIGVNHVQTVYDMLYMHGVDLGIVHSDVLEDMARTQGYDGIERRINALFELFGEKIAVIAGEEYGSLQDLAGRKVNFRTPGKGSDVTATILFDTLGIDVEPTRVADKLEALEQVKSGEIAAMVYLIEEPVEAFTSLSPADGVRLLALPREEALLEHYREARLTEEDFPELIKGEGAVMTLEVPVIVAAYNWPRSETWRYEKEHRFVEALLADLEALRTGPSAERWASASVVDAVPGVPRLAMVDEVVAEREALERRAAEEATAARTAEIRAEQEALMTRLSARLEGGAGDPDELVEMEKLLERMQTILEE